MRGVRRQHNGPWIPSRAVAVIGASAGGVHALLEISQALPRLFSAPVCIVQHIGGNASLLPELLRYRGPNQAMHAQHGQRLTSGTLHVAPPDCHMLLQGDVIHLRHGPKATLTCPDCGGSLWEMKDAKPLRYRCHTGHAYTALSLARSQQDAAEHALWSSVRALRERELLLRRLASIAAATGDTAQAAAGRAQADRLREQVAALDDLAEQVPPAVGSDRAA